jgi:hypothetical protein
MRKRVAIIAAGAALFAVPATAMGEASDNASCIGQSASAPNEPGAKGAFVSAVAKASDRGFSGPATNNAHCKTP